jgi:creatinine amidohydrolase
MPRTDRQPARRSFLKNLLALPAAAATASNPGVADPPAAQTTAETNRNFCEQVGYQLDRHIQGSPLAILPLGSIEYHGPSGPPFTDSVIAAGLAARLAPRLRASVFPVVNFTHCPAHTASFRGSVSIRPEVMTVYFTDILRGLLANGFKKVFVLNGHDGNTGPARMAISQVTHENPSSQMLLVSWWETLPTPLVESLQLFRTGNGGHGHGGPLELSVAAVFAPHSVEPGRGPDLPTIEQMADGFPYYLEKSQAEGWPGYSGKLSEISRDKGERLVKIAVDELAALVGNWLKNESKPGSW